MSLQNSNTAPGAWGGSWSNGVELSELFTEPQAGLYLHLPFCSAVCPYCDFAVLTGSSLRRRAFIGDLISEIELWAPRRRRFATVHLGGGTPSAHEPGELSELVAALKRHLVDGKPREFTLEANPEDVDAGPLERWQQLGIDRLSLGVQAFDPAALRFLGRRHTVEQARRSVRLARAAGLRSVSVDLIYALPGFPVESWLETLKVAVELAPDHLSCYELTLHRGTAFGVRAARGELKVPSHAAQAELFERTHLFLQEAGYEGYEVSNFARGAEHRSLHNQGYWRRQPYLGLGPSAHSFDGLRRWWNARRLADYTDRLGRGVLPIDDGEVLAPRDQVLEGLMLGLRTREGVDLETLEQLSGLPLRARNHRLLERLVGQALVVQVGSRIQPTLRGLAVADRLAAEFDLA